jgi:hypothetical protein
MALARTPGNSLGSVRQTPYPASLNPSGPDTPFKIVEDNVENQGRGPCEHDAENKILETTTRSLRLPLSEISSPGNRGTPTIATDVGQNEPDIMYQAVRDPQWRAVLNFQGKKRKVAQESKGEDENDDTGSRCKKKPRTFSALEQAQEQDSRSSNTAERHTSRVHSPRSSNSLGRTEALAEIDSIFKVANTHAERRTETFEVLTHRQKAEEATVNSVAAKVEQRRKSNCDEPTSVQNTTLPASFRGPKAPSNVTQGLRDASSALAASSTSEPPLSTMEAQPDAPGFGGWVITPESSPGGTLYPVSNE